MEQGTVVAIVALAGSFLTVVVNSISNYLTKKLDAEQKVKEHQLSIRSNYVTRKIDNGEKEINRIQIYQLSLSHKSNVLKDFKREGVLNNQAEEEYKKFRDLVFEHSMQTNYTAVYFDLIDLNKKFNSILDKSDILSTKIAPIFYDDELTYKDYAADIDELLIINEELIVILGETAITISDELRKYDIL